MSVQSANLSFLFHVVIIITLVVGTEEVSDIRGYWHSKLILPLGDHIKSGCYSFETSPNSLLMNILLVDHCDRSYNVKLNITETSYSCYTINSTVREDGGQQLMISQNLTQNLHPKPDGVGILTWKNTMSSILCRQTIRSIKVSKKCEDNSKLFEIERFITMNLIKELDCHIKTSTTHVNRDDYSLTYSMVLTDMCDQPFELQIKSWEVLTGLYTLKSTFTSIETNTIVSQNLTYDTILNRSDAELWSSKIHLFMCTNSRITCVRELLDGLSQEWVGEGQFFQTTNSQFNKTSECLAPSNQLTV